MDKQKKIVISHFGGNANVRAAVNAFLQADILDSFHISVGVFNGTWYWKFFSLPLLKDFKKRVFNDKLRPFTHSHSFVGLGRLICQKLRIQTLLKHETGAFCVDKECEYIDMKTAVYISKHYPKMDAVYCYEDVALQTFQEAKKHGKICLFDEPIGYWRYMRLLLDDEKKKNPDWAITLGGFYDSDNKLKKKDMELALADKIYVASSFTKRSLQEYPGSLAPIEVIPYGFPEPNRNRIFKPFNGRKIRCLYVGGLTQRKGLSYIFEAVKGLEDHVELTIAGGGEIDKCPVLKRALSHVNYVGTLSHNKILNLMSEHDLFLFPSLFEGFGLVITEAMSQGTPCIVTERTSGPDIITHGVDGWIVEAGSSEPIKELLHKLIENPYLLHDAGKAAIKKAESRPWHKYEEELSESVMMFLKNI